MYLASYASQNSPSNFLFPETAFRAHPRSVRLTRGDCRQRERAPGQRESGTLQLLRGEDQRSLRREAEWSRQ